MNVSLVVVTPAALRAQTDAALAALGWGEDNFLVEVKSGATDSTTYFGLRATVSPEFAETLRIQFASFEGDVLIDTRADTDRMNHFDSLLNANGLRRVEPSYVA